MQEMQEASFGKIPWRRKWKPTPVFLPGEFRGQRSLAGYSLWGHKESNTTEATSMLSQLINNVVSVAGDYRRDSVIHVPFILTWAFLS